MENALKTGVCACVTTFYLGYGDDLEAENIRIINEQMRKSARIELPLFVEVKAEGPRIGKQNYSRAIKMAITMLTEWGADGILVPKVREDVFKELKQFDYHPLFVRYSHHAKRKSDVYFLKMFQS